MTALGAMLCVAALTCATLFAAERRFALERRPLLRRGLRADVCYAGIQVAIRFAINGTLAVSLTAWATAVLPEWASGVLRDQPLWIQAVILLVVLDGCFYAMHRLKHRWSWWWRLHETHHSSIDLDFLSAVRFHPIEKALDRILFLAPLAVLGPSAEATAIWACCDTFFGFLIHSNLPLRIGPLRFLFVSPEMHRWHHTRDTAAQQVNFANNFAVFDWLFGTAFSTPEEPTGFGIDEPDYPHESLLRQLAFAFRPFETDGTESATNPGSPPRIGRHCPKRSSTLGAFETVQEGP